MNNFLLKQALYFMIMGKNKANLGQQNLCLPEIKNTIT